MIETATPTKVIRCGWCDDEPATHKVADHKYTVLGGGSAVRSGTSRLADACEDCAERLSKRYGVRANTTAELRADAARLEALRNTSNARRA